MSLTERSPWRSMPPVTITRISVLLPSSAAIGMLEVTTVRRRWRTRCRASSSVVVPNRKIVGEILHNFGRIRQAAVQVGVGYDADFAQALSTIRELVLANTRVLRDPEPIVQIVALGESAVQIAVKPWVSVDDLPAVGGELSLAIVEAWRRRGISAPVPKREVHLIGGSR